jgi:hypothetical protein
VKFALLAPDGTVIEDGTLSAELLSEIATEAPPVDAARERLTVQVDVAPEAIEAGEHCNAETVGGD